ncbi:MAG: cyclopropane fatty acyl phospholipid synthase [Proteobacteria bacterium]|nr:cyclopropane fatty acyl phospholipid synthase [Pseudomonadota bacterium]MBU2262166.1 cyclopropane fatty acyl phospholipid synthase [Pseudomonadota bacterium]
MKKHRELLSQWLAETGVRVDGPDPWDIQVRDDRFYARVLKDGSLGLGESYMEGWWDCRRIDEFICRLLRGKMEEKIRGNPLKYLMSYISAWLFNLQSRARSGMVARRHYDLEDGLFFSFLDPYHQYSCAYFQGTDDLEEAQKKKMDLICRKIDLQREDHVLDIGCGWGGFARYAAEQYGCTVTAVNISKEQIHYAVELCKKLPVQILNEDYRQIRGSFDQIVSVGMFEHVGWKNYRTFMKVVHRCLKEKGVFLLQTIGSNISRFNCDPWIHRYIFPNGMLPSIDQIAKAAERLFVIEDIHNLGTHYERTLISWNERFQKAWNRLAERYDQRFKRMWEYYLLSSAGAFRARHIQVWQIVMTRTGEVQPLCRVV